MHAPVLLLLVLLLLLLVLFLTRQSRNQRGFFSKPYE